MKTKSFLIYASVFLILLMLIAACNNGGRPDSSKAKSDSVSVGPVSLSGDQLVHKGEYLVNTMGCHDCHSPKDPKSPTFEDMADLRFSGYPADEKLPPINKKVVTGGWLLFTMGLNGFVGPWGVSFAANLTSDPSGIGSWMEENFLRALKEGKFKGVEGGRMLLPPMPWQNLSQCTDEDLKAMFAYFKTTKPVHNVVPAAIAPPDVKYQ
jgi:hypothetical protein